MKVQNKAAVPKVNAAPVKSAGLGYDWRITDKSVVGSALVVEDDPIHISSFPVN